MNAIKHTWATPIKGCILENNAIEGADRHNTRQFNRIYAPFPHVFCLNLTWTGAESSKDILRVMLSLPGKFNPD